MAKEKSLTTVEAAEVTAITGGYHGKPRSVLGAHEIGVDGDKHVVVRAYLPKVEKADVLLIEDEQRFPMQCVHEQGFFETVIAGVGLPLPYRFVVIDADGNERELDDPYRFPPLLTTYEIYLHGEGNFLESYRKMGAHLRTVEGVCGVNFAVWAPNAQRVSIIGSFNDWDNRTHPMQRHDDCGIWELFIPDVDQGAYYKYSIKSQQQNYEIDKSDPYAFYAGVRPSTDSRVWDTECYEWHDDEWLTTRAQQNALAKPINIYEVHLGSWRLTPGTNEFLGYRELAHQLVDYVLEMGYTHIELMPITEYPFDGSWGYQVTGYFAPTSRHGTPDDFKYFVDYCHRYGIGVILDWVPAHFPKDAHGLAYFDGTHLYEHADPRQGEHKEWGTKIFNYGRNEVRNFLLSSALFWLREYHLDGLRVDAVAAMLYLDYSREDEDWLRNQYGGRENLEAIDFIRRFNEVTHERADGILTIAEESTSWPMVSRPTYTGGLGFDLKWNMGWMHDMLDYMQMDPIYRRYAQNQITFSLVYAFHENFVLPFSHDEVVHLKRSMLGKMPGDDWQRYANLRVLYAYMMGHPGKKLLFMGSEFGQWQEWSEAKSLDWHLLEGEHPDHERHRQLKRYVADLNQLYRDEPALYEVDADWSGFQWIDISDAERSIVSFVRRARDTDVHMVMVCNFTPEPRHGYRVGLPEPGHYDEVLNSDWLQYGGSGVANSGGVDTEALAWQNCNCSAPLHLPPLGAILLKPSAAE